MLTVQMAVQPGRASALVGDNSCLDVTFGTDCNFVTNAASGPDTGLKIAGTITSSTKTPQNGTLVTLTATSHLTPYWPGGLFSAGMYGLSLPATPGTLVSYSPQSSDTITATVNTVNGVSNVAWQAVETHAAGVGTPTGEFPAGQVFTMTFRFDGTNVSAGAGLGYNALWKANVAGLGNGGGSSEVFVNYQASSPPTAGINYHPTGTAPNEWIFDGSSSIATAPATIAKYDWNFGDGTTASTAQPTVTHQFATEGDRTAQLTVTDSAGLTGTTTTTLSPALTITAVTHDPAALTAGSPFTGTITVENDGTTTITGVSPAVDVVDPTVATLTGPTPTSAGVVPGLSQTFTYVGAALSAGSSGITASAAGRVAGVTVTAPTRSATLAVDAAGLSISLVSPPSVLEVGVPTTLTVRVTTLGRQGATDVSVADPVQSAGAAAFTIVGRPSGSDVGFSLPTTGASHEVSYQVVQTTSGRLSLTFTAHGTDAATSAQSSAAVTAAFDGQAIVVTTTGDEQLPAAAAARNVCDVDPTTAGNQCTLRAAIQLAADRSDATNMIGFDIPGGGVPVIAPTSVLPSVPSGYTIDGTTQPGGWVEVTGRGAAVGDTGLTVTEDDTVRGLVVSTWGQYGIAVLGGTGNVIAGNRIGTNPSGTAAAPLRTPPDAGFDTKRSAGVAVIGAGTAALIGGPGSTAGCTGDCNVISGNDYGIYIANGATATVQGNLIGTDLTGETAIANNFGIRIIDPSEGRTGTVLIGGPTNRPGTGPGNVISGNPSSGIRANLSGPLVVQGNLIGLDRSGERSLQNPPAPGGLDPGVTIFNYFAASGLSLIMLDATTSVTVGGEVAADSNIISGFNSTGIEGAALNADNLPVPQAFANIVVEHDRIGTDLTGEHALPNGFGVVGAGPIEDSQISGNIGNGLLDVGDVTANLIGTTADGRAALGNGAGVVSAQLVGGVRSIGSRTCDLGCNVISGNRHLAVANAGQILGNFIGTDITGEIAIPNNTDVSGQTIDTAPVPPADTAAGPSTEIAYSGQLGGTSSVVATGVCDQACNLLPGSPTSVVLAVQIVQGNLIGLNIDGAPLPNHGAAIMGASPNNDFPAVYGGDGNLGNRIVENTGPAIEFYGQGGAVVEGNVMFDNGRDLVGSGGIVYDTGDTADPPRRPVVSSIVENAGQLSVSGNIPDLATTQVPSPRVDVYAEAGCGDPEGEVPLGSVTTNILHNGAFSFAATVPSGYPAIVATSTVAGATSVFSQCFTPQITNVVSASVSPATASAGTAVTVDASGFTSNESVDVTLHSNPVALARVSAAADGTVHVSVTIPLSTAPGDHHIVLTGLTSGHVVSVPIAVWAATASASGGDLASTGSDVAAGLTSSILALLVGCGLLIGARFRRRTTSA